MPIYKGALVLHPLFPCGFGRVSQTGLLGESRLFTVVRAFSAAQNSQGKQEELEARALEKLRAYGAFSFFFKEKDSWTLIP